MRPTGRTKKDSENPNLWILFLGQMDYALLRICEEKKEKQTGARAAFSKLLINHIGREYSGIRLVLMTPDINREPNRLYKFIKTDDEEVVQ